MLRIIKPRYQTLNDLGLVNKDALNVQKINQNGDNMKDIS